MSPFDEHDRTYQRMADAIRYLLQHAADQPRLADVAAAVHLSEYHLQRLFTQWTGVSPKRFLQQLTVEAAKTALSGEQPLQTLSYELGLSGSSRLHDLFVTHEAMSPGEFKAGGAGLVMRYGFHPSPFGQAIVVTSERGLAGLGFCDAGGEPYFTMDYVEGEPLSHRLKQGPLPPSQARAAGPPHKSPSASSPLRLPLPRAG